MAERVLVIEDDTQFSKILELMLTQKGFHVDVANNAITGL